MRHFNKQRELVENDNMEFWNDLEEHPSADQMLHRIFSQNEQDNKINRKITFKEWWNDNRKV